ncbi:hypothetical protein HDK77DRAFT_485589 [Phyllosticta capitalensis]
MELSYLHQQRQYILSALSKTQIIMDGLHSKIADAERCLTVNASSKIALQADGSDNSSTNNETDTKAPAVAGLGRAQKKKLQQTRWRARTSLRNCENEQQVLFESLRSVQDRILRVQADILDKDVGGWVPPPAAAHQRHHHHQYHHQATPDPGAVMAAYAANLYAGSMPFPATGHTHAHTHTNPYTHYPQGIPPSAYLDPETTSDDLWAWQASDTQGPYAALAPSLLSNDPYQYAYLYQNQQGHDYEWADWDAAGRRFSRAMRSSHGGPGPMEVVDEMGTHHYIYDKEKQQAGGTHSPSKDETGQVAPGVFPEKWELGRPSLNLAVCTTTAADGEGDDVGPTSAVSTAMKAALSIGSTNGRGHKRVQSAALSPKTSVFVPGKAAHGEVEKDGNGGPVTAATGTSAIKSAFATTTGSGISQTSAAHVHFAEPPRKSSINPRATPFKAPSSPYPFPHDGNSSKAKSAPYTPPHRRNSSLNSTASSTSSFVSINGDDASAKQGDGDGSPHKRRYSAAAVDLILHRLKENEGKPRKQRRGQGQGLGHAHSRSADAGSDGNGSGGSEEGEGKGGDADGAKKRGRQGVGWGSVDEPKYKVGGEGDGDGDGDVDMEGVD